MKVHTKIRYGLRAMIELACNSVDKGLFQKDIAVSQHIPIKYLDQIISALKASGLIVNAGGKKSGYKLARTANNITVYDIYTAFEFNLALIDCLDNKDNCDMFDMCETRYFWGDLNNTIIEKLKSKQLSEFVEHINQRKEVTQEMYFI